MAINRSLSRELAFILMFEYVIKGDESAEEIYGHAENYPDYEESPYTKRVFFGTVENYKLVDETVEKCLVGWNKKRISYVSRAVLAIAAYEMMFVEDVPYKVAIDEAINLSKKYDEPNSYTFINGVLNAVAVSLGLK